MRDPAVTIRLDGNGRTYRPGEMLSGQYRLDRVAPADVKAIEVSVLWHSEGKGDEDLAVHEFWRHDLDDRGLPDPGGLERFSTILPESPLSYDGAILRLRWCVRVRVFLHRGKELVGQKVFQLGDVPPAEVSQGRAPHFAPGESPGAPSPGTDSPGISP